jgi:RHS repeat-associated protein
MQSSTDGRGNTTTYSWSPTRHQTGAVYPSTPQGVPATTNFYDVRDWMSQARNPLQQSVYFGNNAAQQMVSVADALLRTNTFLYDPDSHCTNSTDAASEPTSSTNDPRGLAITLKDAAGGIVGKKYDGNGNTIYLTNRDSKVWQFQFDGANRLTNTISPTGKATGRVFNNRGLLQSVKDAAGNTSSFQYDAKGRIVTNVDNVGTRVYSYDPDDNVGTNSENGQTLISQYDAYDRLTAFTNASGYIVQYNYDNNGNVTGLTYPGGLAVSYTLDSMNHVTSVTDWASRVTTNTYDLAGKLTGTTRPNGTTRTLSFDTAGEMTNIVERYTTGAMAIEYIARSYNNAARVQWEFVAPLPQPYTPPSRTITVDADNRLATVNGNSVTMDNNGNMTYGPGTNSTFENYTFDARNRLTSAGGLSYGYDSAGGRTVMTNGATVTSYVIDPKTSQVLMRIRPNLTNYYIYGPGLLYEIDTTATTTNLVYYHFDAHGSTVALTDASGNVTDRMEYSAYGMPTYRFGTNDTPFLYNGQFGVQTDINGLMFMRARYYNPYICRFINADPSGFSGGLNMYQFADGNPISELDPFGLGYWSDVGQVWIGYGQAIGGTLTGLYNVAAHPINTAVGLYNVAAHPVQAYNAISTSFVNTWNSGLQGQGQIVGNALIIAGTFGAGSAVGTSRLIGIGGTLADAEIGEDVGYAGRLAYYEVGQKTMLDANFATYADIANPVERGAEIVEDIGWMNALTSEGSGWFLGIGKNFGTDPTPLGWLGLAGTDVLSEAGQLGQYGEEANFGNSTGPGGK